MIWLNVSEWVLDEYHHSYDGAPLNELAWCEDMGECISNPSADRILRGGSWFYDESSLRSCARRQAPSNRKYSSFGFRISRQINQ